MKELLLLALALFFLSLVFVLCCVIFCLCFSGLCDCVEWHIRRVITVVLKGKKVSGGCGRNFMFLLPCLVTENA